MYIYCVSGIVVVSAHIFMREMDIEQIITKIDIYNFKCRVRNVRTSKREPNLIRTKGR